MEDNYIDDGLMSEYDDRNLDTDLEYIPEYELDDNPEENEHIEDSLSDWDDNDEPDIEPWDGE